MANLALGRSIEETISHAAFATDGVIRGYTGDTGFAHFSWPGILTVDLDEICSIVCLRILLWDGLGGKAGTPAERVYKYRLLGSKDHNEWRVIFDSSNNGQIGWQVFHLSQSIDMRYVRIHGLWNSANAAIHIVQVEAHDVKPEPLDVPCSLARNISLDGIDVEVGDGRPIASTMSRIVLDIEKLVEQHEYLKAEPFKRLTNRLRLQVGDINAIENSMEAIRREIVGPVLRDLRKSARIGRISLIVGIVGGVLAIIALLRSLS